MFVAPPQRPPTRWERLTAIQKVGVVIGAIVLGAGALRLLGWATGAGVKSATTASAASTPATTTANAPAPASSITEAQCAAMGPGYEMVLRIDPRDGSTSSECRQTASSAPASDGRPGLAIARASWEVQHGANSWPARSASGRIECVGPSMVFFIADDQPGVRFAVNGAATGCLDEKTGLPHAKAPIEFCRGARDFRTIWLDDPHPPKGGEGFKITLGDFIGLGLGLCK